MFNLSDLAQLEVDIMMQKHERRQRQLGECKTQEEKDKLLDRWAIEDAAESITKAINRRNWF